MFRAILIVFNLPGIDHIVMSLTVLADIYLGKIDYWNDARIQQYNKELLLPRQKIVPVARIDSTADTNVFTQALSSFSAEWEQNFGIFGGNESRWPSFIQYFAKKPIGLIGVVSSIPYTIGYSQQQNVVDAALNYVTLINQQNSIVQPTGQSIQSAINYWYSINNASENLNNANVSDAYPIVTYTYITIDSASVDLSCCSVRETVGWLISLLTYSEYLNKAAGYYFVHLK